MRNFKITDEGAHQETIMQWCALQKNRYPELDLLYHVPNGGRRDKATAMAMKRQGVKAGVSDLVLPVARKNYHGLYLELKAPGGCLEQSQKDFLQKVEQQGYLGIVCVGWTAAVDALKEYLDGKEVKREKLKTKTTPKEGTFSV